MGVVGPTQLTAWWKAANAVRGATEGLAKGGPHDARRRRRAAMRGTAEGHAGSSPRRIRVPWKHWTKVPLARRQRLALYDRHHTQASGVRHLD
jgi:hypothetical protein